MTVLTSSLEDRESQRQIGMNWVSGFLVFSLFVLAIGIGTQAYWRGNEEWLRSVVFGAFTVINSLRILGRVVK